MEFLMTYGWSVLIVTAVLVTLFNMGIFNSSTYTPKAQPGNCKVLRTGGFTNLEGTCSGVPPQSVAVFNGGSSYVSVPNSASLNTVSSITISAWIYTVQTSTIGQAIASTKTTESGTSGFVTEYYSTAGNVQMYWGNGAGSGGGTISSSKVVANSWVQVVYVLSGNTYNAYINGANIGSYTSANSFTSASGNPLQIGLLGAGTYPFNGDIANVQIYNTTLDASQIQLLYTKGIGAAPIAPQYVVGWWPLNGNANDYSGNNGNGAATGITYTSSWTAGYTAP
jgi:hypothetical protein